MKRTHYLIISFLLCGACRQHKDSSLVQMTAIIKSLDRSNGFISQQIDKARQSLQKRSYDPQAAEITKNWLPCVDSVRSLSKEMRTYLNSLRSALTIRARIVADTTDVPPGWGDKEPVYGLFEDNGIKKELSRKIAAYHTAILNAWNPDHLPVSDGIKKDIKINIPKMITHASEDLVYRLDPANTTTVSAYILLDQIENDFLLTEYEMIRYADIHTDVIYHDYYEKFSVMVGANSSYLKAGQTLIIDAGVGQFSLTSHPKISINGIPLVMADGVAEYRTVVGQAPGKHTIPIKIEYMRPDGSPQTVYKDVKYEIAP